MKEILSKQSKETRCYIMAAIMVFQGYEGVDEMTESEYRTAAINAVKQLSADVGIPATLKEIGVKEEDLDALADAAMADVCTGGNPRPCTKELVLEVYKTAFGE